jgi:hypothetical protein
MHTQGIILPHFAENQEAPPIGFYQRVIMKDELELYVKYVLAACFLNDIECSFKRNENRVIILKLSILCFWYNKWYILIMYVY